MILRIFIMFSLLLLVSCSAIKEKTGAFVTLREVGKDEIVVENQSKEKITIEVPKVITKLLEINKEYYIEYENFKGQTPELVSIDPIK